MAEDLLKHFGVLGMHWGHRKGGGGKASKKSPAHADHEDARHLESKGIHALSTMELKRLNNRLQLEKTYKELKPPTKAQQRLKGLKSFNSTFKTLDETYKIADSTLGRAIGRQALKTKTSKKIKKALWNSGKLKGQGSLF